MGASLFLRIVLKFRGKRTQKTIMETTFLAVSHHKHKELNVAIDVGQSRNQRREQGQ
jgi:hypothetical protein